jgi:predicted peptidase
MMIKLSVSRSTLTKVLSLFLCFGIISNSFSQSSHFSYEKYTNEKGETLNYRQLLSDYDSSSTYPLVIFLHGSGERGNDNESQLKWGVHNFASDEVMKMHRSIVLVPQCPSNMDWANISYEDMRLNPSPSLPMKLLRELIDQTVQNLPVDTNRIYITGLSMGGFGVFDALSRYPDLFAAAVPVCGGGDVSRAPSFSNVPIWIFHGALDDAVDSVHSQDMLIALTKAGGRPGYTQYPETGHFSWIAAYSDPMMMNWLYRQRK